MAVCTATASPSVRPHNRSVHAQGSSPATTRPAAPASSAPKATARANSIRRCPRCSAARAAAACRAVSDVSFRAPSLPSLPAPSLPAPSLPALSACFAPVAFAGLDSCFIAGAFFAAVALPPAAVSFPAASFPAAAFLAAGFRSGGEGFSAAACSGGESSGTSGRAAGPDLRPEPELRERRALAGPPARPSSSTLSALAPPTLSRATGPLSSLSSSRANPGSPCGRRGPGEGAVQQPHIAEAGPQALLQTRDRDQVLRGARVLVGGSREPGQGHQGQV